MKIHSFFLVGFLLFLTGCQPKEKNSGENLEPVITNVDELPERKVEKKISHPFDREYDNTKITYQIPRKFDYSLLVDMSKFPKRIDEFYPIGYSADWKYFCFIQKEHDFFSNNYTYFLIMNGCCEETENNKLRLDTINSIKAIDDLWRLENEKITQWLRKYQIIQEEPLDFKFQHGGKYSSDKDEYQVFMSYVTYKSVMREVGKVTDMGTDTLQIELSVTNSQGDNHVFYTHELISTLAKHFQIVGAFNAKKHFYILSVYQPRLASKEFPLVTFDLITLPID